MPMVFVRSLRFCQRHIGHRDESIFGAEFRAEPVGHNNQPDVEVGLACVCQRATESGKCQHEGEAEAGRKLLQGYAPFAAKLSFWTGGATHSL